MSDTPKPSIPATTGIKRKAEPSYDELKEEVKELKAKLKESRDQYNAVVPKYTHTGGRSESQRKTIEH